MSGHSKWATIKRTKAVVDQKRGVVYAKMAREIIVAAKLGGPDPAGNFRLRTAIERAKAEGVPNDNIERAIEKGAGTGGADSVEELTYEGYGPGGVAVLVKCATDNRNRTAGDIRSYFSKYGGNLGDTGCVNWMFKERGELQIDKESNYDEDSLLTAASDAGADDLLTEESEEALVICSSDKMEKVKEAIEKSGHKIISAEVNMSPLSTVSVQDADIAKQLLKLLDVLENHDDVQHVFANFDMDEKLMQEFMSN
ncbi:YebC/PmpR family DNA-binding transcriptional regulator [Candidatus Obscuribacterales bacterium]|nr:YebC/PmpR family DNA-binding transcriptional regulator [Candidatus Obscuribacterales bacterium]MBX3136445.1 YebC/PmpR family DNA-binding transcriptional regulator [Candidatus Obscuribacterales bacterium]MBX3152355.1 YebC/PmpR family DNA-binding transcriptional regulator [Candidatus Obscuribacterales bacterium]